MKYEENKKNVTMISIHIRLTDYESHLKHYYNMTTISKDYLMSAMEYFHQKYNVSIQSFVLKNIIGLAENEKLDSFCVSTI